MGRPRNNGATIRDCDGKTRVRLILQNDWVFCKIMIFKYFIRFYKHDLH